MTFLELKQRTAGRTNLSSTPAYARLGQFINERYRAVATSIGLGQVRRGTVTVNTTVGAATVSPVIVKPLTVRILALNTVLDERTVDQLRLVDPSNTWTGDPELYAVANVGASTVTLELRPIPSTIRTLSIDAILRGVDLIGDDDVPVVPEDFHDILIFGAAADEYMHFDKFEFAKAMEARFEKRLRELRYFLAKSAYLSRGQNVAPQWWAYNRGLTV